jgi:DNA-binding NarL/FixJ family response regulator
MRSPVTTQVEPGRAPATVAEAPVRVVVVDDHDLVRRSLVEMLSSQQGIEVVGECGCAVLAPSLILALRPDVAVLDVRLGDGDGIAICREVRAIDPSIAVIALTCYEDEASIAAAAEAGAAAYLLKDIRGGGLVDWIQRVGKRRSDPASRTAEAVPGAPLALTDRDRRILQHLADGLTDAQIARAEFLAEKTVRDLVARLLVRLELRRREQAAWYAATLLEERRPPAE